MKYKFKYLLALLAICIAIESCSHQTPSEMMMDLLVQYIEILKSTHIHNQKDVDELKDKIEILETKKEQIKELEMQMMKEMTQEEIEDYSLKMMEKMERSGIMEISKQESDRIKREAEKAGLEFDLF
ncbi:hypothetical protein [Prevotella sp. P6B1]|uniref:hypothetical protein n=1 Tax=Prevotella sp. P6B1 TaxID=1410613 RepID=UPI0012DD0101|nr:hypothetical protein [Prevotella sp. P6B1]